MEEVKNTQPSCRAHFEHSELAATSVADPTCAGLYSALPILAPGCLIPSPEVTESMPTVWHMSIAMVCSPALLCPQGWWSSFQSTVTPAMPCASYTNLLHAQDLHFPKGTYNFVQLTEGIPSLTCRGVVSDKTEAEFLRHA